MVLPEVSIQSSDKFCPGEENVGSVHCAHAICSYCPVAPQHISLPGIAQEAFQEHKSSQKLSEPF